METQTDETKQIYSTRDLNLAATLTTLKFYLESLDFQIEGSKQQAVGYFNFDDCENLQEAIQKYWRDELSVEPKLFMNNVRSLKAQITNVYKGPRVDMGKFKTKDEGSKDDK